MPIIEDVTGPGLLVGRVSARRKKRKRPAYGYSRVPGHSVTLGRAPTPLEERVLSLVEIPTRLNEETTNLVDALTFLRRIHLETAQRSAELIDFTTSIADLLLSTHQSLARYGAEERRLEWSRQDVELDDDPEPLTFAPATTRLATEIAQELTRDWTAALVNAEQRLQRARPQATAEEWHRLAERHVDLGLARSARCIVNGGFALGRALELARAKGGRGKGRGGRGRRAQAADVMVFTAVLDANTCAECEDVDGTTFDEGSPEADELDVPYYLCESTASGQNLCRCINIAVDSEPGWVNAALIEHLEILHLAKEERDRVDLDSAASIKAWDTRGRQDASPNRQKFESRWPYGPEMDAYAQAHGDNRLEEALHDFWSNQQGGFVVPPMDFQLEVIQAGAKRISKERRAAKQAKLDVNKPKILEEMARKYGYTIDDVVFDKTTGTRGVVKWGRDGQPFVKSAQGNHYVGARWEKSAKKLSDVPDAALDLDSEASRKAWDARGRKNQSAPEKPKQPDSYAFEAALGIVSEQLSPNEVWNYLPTDKGKVVIALKHLHDNQGSVELHWLVAEGRGAGRLAMEHITKTADAHGTPLSLWARPMPGQGENEGLKLSKPQLERFYRSFGFKRVDQDPKGYSYMRREPTKGARQLSDAFDLDSEASIKAWDTRGRAQSGDSHKEIIARGDRPVPIKVKKIKDAIRLILEGKVVELPNVRKVNTLLERLAQMAIDAEKRGEQAPNYDLCQVSVPGTNIFCGASIRTKEYPNGLPRVVMPQLHGSPRPGSRAAEIQPDKKGRVDIGPEFIDHLESRGITTESVKVPAATIRASQAQLEGPRVAAKVLQDKKANGPIFISRDDYIVDGHHRWAAQVGRDARDGKLGDILMRAIKIDAPISEILLIANKWTEEFGLPHHRRMHDDVDETIISLFDPDPLVDGDAFDLDTEDSTCLSYRDKLFGLRRAGMEVVLTPPVVEQRLAALEPGWTSDGTALTKTFSVPNSRCSADFVRQLMAHANEVNHHPHVTVEHETVTVLYSTRSADGITALDFAGAAFADQISHDATMLSLDAAVIDEVMSGDVARRALSDEMVREALQANNDVVVEQTVEDLLAQLAHEFPLMRLLDPQSLTVDDDQGDGAPLVDTEQLAFVDGTRLNAAEQEMVVALWDALYAKNFEEALANALEIDQFQWDELPTLDVPDITDVLDDDTPAEPEVPGKLFDAGDSDHGGLLVSLWLDPQTADLLAVPGGEPPEQLHITLCYCGSVDALDDVDIARAITSIDEIARHAPQLDGFVGALGRFDATEHSDGKEPIIAEVDIPNLLSFRQRIADALTQAGCPPRANFEYHPHLTLEYVEPGAPDPVWDGEGMPLSFRGVTISTGDKQLFLPFGPRVIENSAEAIQQFLLDSAASIKAWDTRGRGTHPVVAAAEHELRGQPTEHAAVIREGKVVLNLTNGATDHVLLPEPTTPEGQQMRDAIFTHNHPGNNAFSPDDLAAAARFNMAEVRAVTDAGTFSMKRVDATWPATLLDLAAVIEADLRHEFTGRIRAGTLSVDEANRLHWAELWRRVARETPKIQFAFEPVP